VANPIVALMFPIDADQRTEIESCGATVVDLSYLPLTRGAEMTAEQQAEASRLLPPVEVMLGQSNIDPRWLEAATSLRWFQITGAGVDRLAEAGVLGRFTVTNGSGRSAVPIAESVITYILALAKQLPLSLANQRDHRWERHRGSLITGATCGIVGMGAIGREVALRARALGMRVVASRRTIQPGDTDPDCDLLLPFSDLDQMLAAADYLVLAAPLTAETRGLIGAAELAKMKPTACIVNIARGPMIDQPALVAALNAGRIAGAALDVTTPEPLPPDDPLWDCPNTIITPHMSGAGGSNARRDTAAMFIASLRKYLAGEELDNPVDPVLGY
jgi:phosphoglycerate dehydrogenase-like enzyme